MRIVKIPVQRIANRRMVRKMEDTLIQKLGRLPSTEEIAKALGITSQEVNRAMEVMQNDLSLDIKIDENETVSLLDFLRANPEQLEDSVVRGLLAGELEERMSNLSDTEKLVLRMRFGLNGELCHRLREIGEVLNLSRERVRQIEQKALEKLRRKTE